jgi:hypothetical protein
MSIFDLLFIVAFLTSVATLATAAVMAIRGRREQALKTFGIYPICAAGYLATGVAVALLKPQRVLHAGDPWCFDDWCLTVEGVVRTPEASQVSYNVQLRISSRAGRVAQRAAGAWVYLIDSQGHRYSPDQDPSSVPLDVLLQPQESVTTSRIFRVPSGVHDLGLITGHGGPYCGPMDILIIGEGGCLFGKPTMITISGESGLAANILPKLARTHTRDSRDAVVHPAPRARAISNARRITRVAVGVSEYRSSSVSVAQATSTTSLPARASPLTASHK